jgi:hypothetical protein
MLGRRGQRLATCRCLTPQSRGRPQAGFAHLRPPLTSNVSPLPQSPSEVVVQQALPASAPVLNSNTRAFQRWPQQASPAASTATAAQLVPSVATQQACAAGPSKSGLPHTPVARCQSPRRRSRQGFQYKRPRCVGSSPSQGEGCASSGFSVPTRQVGSNPLFRSRPVVASARLLASNTRQAKPAEMHRHPFSRRASSPLRANPSVKGTKCGKPHFAPYLER